MNQREVVEDLHSYSAHRLSTKRELIQVIRKVLRVLLAAYILAFLVKTKLAPELAVTRASWTGGYADSTRCL